MGKIENDEIPSFLSISDIYVSTSLSDGGLASSTAEAMACELPIIITDFGENKKWIHQGKNGCIFPMKNHIELSKNIIELIDNKNIRKRIGHDARSTILKHFNYKIELNKLDKIYKEALANKIQIC